MKPSICFIAHNAYGALAQGKQRHVGGIERQQTLISVWLAERGYPVSMVTWDEGQPDGILVRGVRVYRMCPRSAGIRGIRFFYPRWVSLVGALRRANADIYYYNCGDLGLGQTVLWAHRNGRQVVFSVASDPDCNPSLPKLKSHRERVLYRYGLFRANQVVVQTRKQQNMLHKGFGIESKMTKMPCVGFNLDHSVVHRPPSTDSSRVLWVGRISREKRLEWLLDIAKRCPQIIFDIVGASNTGTAYADELFRRAESIANVKMYGRVVHDQMERIYRRAFVLCNTSMYEGFPNTFLEAWSVGVPVISTVDPDGLITAHGLGHVASTVDRLEECLRELIASPSKWQLASKAAQTYFLKNHTLNVTMPQFEHMFTKLSNSHCL